MFFMFQKTSRLDNHLLELNVKVSCVYADANKTTSKGDSLMEVGGDVTNHFDYFGGHDTC
jgi:hypothetical protein